MKRERLQLALERLRSDQWKIFEEFASEYLSLHYPNLRTVASASGDKGRDADLFSPDGRPKVVLQYSIASNWKQKIRDTAKRLEIARPSTRILIFVTNRSVLSEADELKQKIFDKYNMALDIHDQDWFLDRASENTVHETASERLAKLIVDPLLSSKGILEHSAPTLTSTEYQAALTFLQLQLEDDTRAKGLTRLSFEALVRTILRNTHSEARMTRTEIYSRIASILPHQHEESIKSFTDSALNRLVKRFLRHWKKFDEFCLTHEESQRVKGRLAEIEIANTKFDEIILQELEKYDNVTEDSDALCELIRFTINNFLLDRGEMFATAVANEKVDRLGFRELEDAVKKTVDLKIPKWSPVRRGNVRNLILEVSNSLLVVPHDDLLRHLRSKADAYTMFAFLGQTPDIQSAAGKMFSHGTIWLDTTIALPLFAETLLEVGHKRFTQMLKAASEANLKLRITPGVIEEIERHMNRCLVYARREQNDWTGRIPFLADSFLRSGQSLAMLPSWIEQFEGLERPEDDLSEYLEKFFGIQRESLEEDELRAPEEVRNIVFETWRSAHDKRRSNDGQELDEISIQRLVRHDVENYLGVVERRRDAGLSPLGYSDWWLTLDRVAIQVDDNLKSNLGRDAPQTPLMSADFLVNCLSFGPVRSRISKESSSFLPVFLEVDFFSELPADLLEEATRIRQESSDLPEHIIQRRVRDHLDAAKRRRGKVTEEGVQFVLDEIDRTVRV